MWGLWNVRMWVFGKYPEIIISIIYEAEGEPQKGSVVRSPPHSELSMTLYSHNIIY